MGNPFDSMELVSFMSCSKGYMGECGIRGGYGELVNMDPDVKAMLFKSISAKLCPTVIGQVRNGHVVFFNIDTFQASLCYISTIARLVWMWW